MLHTVRSLRIIGHGALKFDTRASISFVIKHPSTTSVCNFHAGVGKNFGSQLAASLYGGNIAPCAHYASHICLRRNITANITQTEKQHIVIANMCHKMQHLVCDGLLCVTRYVLLEMTCTYDIHNGVWHADHRLHFPISRTPICNINSSISRHPLPIR